MWHISLSVGCNVYLFHWACILLVLFRQNWVGLMNFGFNWERFSCSELTPTTSLFLSKVGQNSGDLESAASRWCLEPLARSLSNVSGRLPATEHLILFHIFLPSNSQIKQWHVGFFLILNNLHYECVRISLKASTCYYFNWELDGNDIRNLKLIVCHWPKVV